jgi:hypothetical protein
MTTSEVADVPLLDREGQVRRIGGIVEDAPGKYVSWRKSAEGVAARATSAARWRTPTTSLTIFSKI